MKIDRTRASRKAARRYNVSPVARAVRSVLTISAAALMFSGSGVVFAKVPVQAPAITPTPSARAALSHDFAKVADLTRIDDAWIPGSVRDEEFQSLGAPMMSAASAMSFASAAMAPEEFGPVDDPSVLPGSFHPGPGGVAGSDNGILLSLPNISGTTGIYGTGSFTSTTGYAIGVFAASPDSLILTNYATITTTAATWSAPLEIETVGDLTVVNNGVLNSTVTGVDGIAFGIYGVSDAGAAITNNSTIGVNANADDASAFGLYAIGFGSDASTTNNGTINATTTKYAGGATGMYAASWDGNASGTNVGAINISGEGDLVGASAFSYYGNASQLNSGTITVSGGSPSPVASSNPIGLYAYSVNGDALVDNDNTVKVDGDFAIGAWAKSYAGSATVDNGAGASVNVNGKYSADGLVAGSYLGAASITNAGDVSASSMRDAARGVFAYGDTANVLNDGTIVANGYTSATGIEASGVREARVTNHASIDASASGDVFGIYAGSNGVASVLNSGSINAHSIYGAAYGVYAIGASAYAGNFSTIDASSTYGAAIGLNVIGLGALTNNDDTINAIGGDLAAGMFTYGVQLSHSYNYGEINATATGTEGFAVGMFAVAGDDIDGDGDGDGNALAVNIGTLNVTGADATGIDTRGGLYAGAVNMGQVYANGGNVVGISAVGTYQGDVLTREGANANVLNYGVVDAQGDLSAVGIQAVSREYLGNASVFNGYYVSAVSTNGQAQGIVVSADIAGSVDNQGGVYTLGGENAYGILALTADGDINVDNGNYVLTKAGGIGRYDAIAYGIATQSNNGHITINNDGDISTYGEAVAMGVYAATKWNNVDITNNGNLFSIAYAGAATGAIAITYDHDANVTNTLDGTVQVLGAASAIGLRSISLYADANVTNDGSIQTYSLSRDRGITARSLYGGTATITNSETGFISTNAASASYGAWARGDFGAALVDNAGTIQSSSDTLAFGALSGGYYASNIVNNGDILAGAGSLAIGAFAYSYGYYVAGSAGIENNHYLFAASDNRAYGARVEAPYGIASMVNGADASIVASAVNVADAIRINGNTVDLHNYGSLSADADGWAAGIEATGGDVTLVSHTGADIHATAYNIALGMYANAATGDAIVRNGGNIDAFAYGAAFGTYAAALQGNAVLTNGGDLLATSVYGNAYGMFGAGRNADASNSDLVKVSAYNRAVGITAIGDTHAFIVNNGDIVTNAVDGTSIGMYASAVHFARAVNNVGATTDVHADYGRAIGAYAYGSDRGEVINETNAVIDAIADHGFAYGAKAYGDVAIVTNRGTINAHSGEGYAIGALGLGLYDGSTVAIDNSGATNASADTGIALGLAAYASGDVSIANNGAHASVDSHADMNAIGIAGTSTYGNLTVTSSGAITATATGEYGIATGIQVSAYNDVDVTMTGALNVSAYDATGIDASGTNVFVTTGGTSEVTGYFYAVGVLADGDTAMVDGDGAIHASVTGADADALGIAAYGLPFASIDNHGDIAVEATRHAYGAIARAADARITNGGAVDVQAHGNAAGLLAIGNKASLTNNGEITVVGGDDVIALGVNATTTASLVNNARVTAVSSNDGAQANAAEVRGNTVSFGGTGSLTAITEGVSTFAAGALIVGDKVTLGGANDLTGIAHGDMSGAVGLLASGVHGITGSNAGDIYGVSYASSAGGAALFANNGDVNFTNTGSIGAHGASDAIGLQIGATNATFVNGGTLFATQADYAVALMLEPVTGTATVTNNGHIVAQADDEEGRIAILGGDATDLITNNADITGALVLGAGNDRLTNAAHGIWTVTGNATDFGAGNDAITNAGRINLHDASISLGANSGAGNTFTNTGVISVLGDSFIDMGTGAPPAPLNNAMLASAPMSVLNAAAFTNNGTINFVDGAPDDTLTIAGDFAGQGNLNVDVSLLHGTSDMLYVDGNIASGSVTKVNINVLDLLPAATDVDIPVVVVQGESGESNVQMGTIVAGQLGLNPNNFLNMRVTVKQQVTGAAGMFALTLGLDGLNDTGSLAAGIAPGAHSLMASQVGTFRQRMGQFTQLGNGDKGAWVRVFGDKGSINPEAQFANFPSTGNYAFDQTNQGVEAGVNALITDGVYIGATLSKSKGKQDLDAGLGRDDIDGTTVGASLTWLGTNGMYADVSYRWMHFDADLTSLAGPQEVGGDAGAFNIEAGWNVFTSEGGLKLVPQAQYTRTKVEGIDRIDGDLASFVSNGGTSSRGRIGLELQQTIQSSGNTWTPYGVLSIVREFDGESRFVVADSFVGHTSTEGTSGLLEVGVNAKVNQRVDFWGGLNYMDGGAIDGVWGGQVGLRYTW